MRTPDNPIKNNPQLIEYKRHRIIMPVYIPNHSGYYQDALRIFKICLDSLIATTRRESVNITIINNASVPEVESFVQEKIKLGEVDQYIYNSINRGKADTIVAAAKATYEPFVTFTDADVLFLPGWLEQIERTYHAFNNAGVVCPFPAPHLKFHFTCSTWMFKFFRIRFAEVVDSETLDVFEKNLGIDNFFKYLDKRKQFYTSNRGVKALIGAGHFVATYRTSVFKSMRYQATQQGLKGGLREIERHVDKLGFMRLSITRNFVLHMGNVFEPWMKQEFKGETPLKDIVLKNKERTFLMFVPYWLRTQFSNLIMYSFLLGVKFKLLK